MYPSNTANIFLFLGFNLVDFDVTLYSAGIEVKWHSVATQPTEQEVTDAGNDLTVVNSQVFTVWEAENGGDVTLTARKNGVDGIDLTGVGASNLIRAVALVTLDEINLLRAEHSLAARTFTQMRNAIKGKINAGDVDS